MFGSLPDLLMAFEDSLNNGLWKVRVLNNHNLLLIIPAFNEGKNIKKVLAEIRSCYDHHLDILVIDDGSTDNTLSAASEAGTDIIALPYNLGYGGALQTGFKYAVKKDYQYAIQFDGDGQHDPEDIKTIIDLLLNKHADIVIGSRFLGRGNFQAGWMKKIAIAMFRSIIKITTGIKITDPSSGLQGLSREAFGYYAKMGNFPPDYPDADILIQMILNGYKIKEFPANIRIRNHGTSMHVGLKPLLYFMKMLVSIMVVLLRSRSIVKE